MSVPRPKFTIDGHAFHDFALALRAGLDAFAAELVHRGLACPHPEGEDERSSIHLAGEDYTICGTCHRQVRRERSAEPEPPEDKVARRAGES